jgi:hypothetical protein
MHGSLAALTCFALLAVAACDNPSPSAPQSAHGDNWESHPEGSTASANANCRFTVNPPGSGPPATIVNIPVGGSITFNGTPAADCDGAFGVLTPTDGRLEFNLSGSPCTDFQEEEAGPFRLLKVYRCFAGGASLSIYTNSSKTTLLQTIGIDVLP